jgi:transposase
METLKSHYRLLLGLDKSWDVTSVDLNVGSKSVTIALEYRGRGDVCPECKAECGLKDHAPERTWRHLDTMQFEKILKARIPRVNCSKCGVKTISLPWGEKYSRFTLMFEAFAIEVLQCAASVTGTSHRQVRRLDRTLEKLGVHVSSDFVPSRRHRPNITRRHQATVIRGEK